MTPSERAAKLERELFDLASLCEGTASVQHQAIAAGTDRRMVGVGPEIIEQVGKRIRHMLADMGPLPEQVDHCLECGTVQVA